MRIGSADKIDALPPDMTPRFCEGALVIAITMLTQKSTASGLGIPEKFELYVSPYYGSCADSVLNYPRTLFVLGLVERGILNRHAYICPDIAESGLNARWAVEGYIKSECAIVVSAGTTLQFQVEPEVIYKR